MNTDQSIETAVARVKSGNKEAFREIIRETAPILRAYVSFFIAERAIVDEVVQSVYVQAYQTMDQYRDGTAFVAWLKTKAKYAALSERRRRQRRRAAHEKYVEHVTVKIAMQAVRREELQPIEERLAALRECLAKLGERMRALVEMKYFKNMRLDDIARIMEMKSPAVALVLHRTRNLLADCIQSIMAKS